MIKTYPGVAPFFFKNGKLLSYLTSEVRVVDFETDSIVFRRDEVDSYTVSPDDSILAVGIWNEICLYDTKTWQIFRKKTELIDPKWLNGVKVVGLLFLPGKREILIVAELYGERARFWYENYIWDLETDSVRRSSWLLPISITPDGTKMAYRGGGKGRLATVIDLRTNEEISYIPVPPPPMDTIMKVVVDLSISPDDRYMIYTIREWDGRDFPYLIAIWDIEKHQLVYTFPADKNGLAGYSCAFSPNGKYFAIGYSIFLFDFEKIKRKIEAVGVEEKPQQLNATIVYPNPTHDVLQVGFTLDSPLQTTKKVLDLLGNTVKTIEDNLLESGEHIYKIDLTDVSSGKYYLQIKAKNRLFNEKIVVSR